MSTIKNALGTSKKFLEHNSPHILTATAVAGVVTTAVLAAKVTPEARDIYVSGCARHGEDYKTIDVVKDTWKLYLPAVAVGAATITCVVASNRVSSAQAATLAGAYTITEKAFTEYKDKIKTLLPQDKQDEIRESIIKDRMTASKDTLPAIRVHDGDELCYDVYSGRYFASNRDEINRCLNMLNQSLISNAWIDLNTWYSLIGLHNIRIGDEFGWTTDNLVDVKFGATVADDGRPCLTVDFAADPRPDAYRVHGF